MDITPRPLRVVVTGVESSGKTTMAQRISQHFQFPLALEAARYDPRVKRGEVDPKDLDRLIQIQFQAAIKAENEALQNNSAGMISDTGGLVLEIWSTAAFGSLPDGCQALQRWFDLYILCPPNIPWEPDPLRSLPNLDDRMALHRRYLKRLQEEGYVWVEAKGTSSNERFLSVVPTIERASNRSLSE